MNTKQVLIVDDDDIHNFLAEESIKMHFDDVQVVVKNRAQEGLDYLEDHAPDVLLLDINMQVMNGFEFLEEYCNRGYDTRSTSVLMLSTSFYDKDINRAKDFTVVKEYVVKPYDYARLAAYFRG